MYCWKIRNSVLFVTITNVLVPVFYHSMVEKQKPSFWHGAHYLFKSSGPDKGLLCHGCVQAWKFFLKVVAAVFDFAFWIFVVFHMQAIHNFSHFEPHQIVRFRKGQWFPSYAELIQITHIVICHDYVFPLAFVNALQSFEEVLNGDQEDLARTFRPALNVKAWK